MAVYEAQHHAALHGPNSVGIRRKTVFKRGTLFRHALDVLRPAAEPLTTREVVLAILRTNGIAEPTARQVRDLYGAVQSSLRSRNGKAVTLVGEGTRMRWKIIP
jgi:hypothetical protein